MHFDVPSSKKGKDIFLICKSLKIRINSRVYPDVPAGVWLLGKRGAEKLAEEITGPFSGGGIAEEDMDEMMPAIQKAYVIAKRNNRKYTKKYRRHKDGE